MAGQPGKVPALGIKLPEQAVQILVCTFLPGTIWVGKIDLAMQSFFNAAPVGKLRAPVAVMVLTSCGGKAGTMQRQWRSPWSPPVGPTSSWQCKTESCAPPGWQSRLYFCPGHSPLYPLPNARLPHGCIPTCPSCGSTFPLLYFPRVSFAPWLFPLSRQYFQVPIYQVFLVDPPVDGTPSLAA